MCLYMNNIRYVSACVYTLCVRIEVWIPRLNVCVCVCLCDVQLIYLFSKMNYFSASREKTKKKKKQFQAKCTSESHTNRRKTKNAKTKINNSNCGRHCHTNEFYICTFDFRLVWHFVVSHSYDILCVYSIPATINIDTFGFSVCFSSLARCCFGFDFSFDGCCFLSSFFSGFQFVSFWFFLARLGV